MLNAVPKSIFSWGYHVYSHGEFLADIDMAWVREGGSFSYNGREYNLQKEGVFSGHFCLECDGIVAAEAQKTAMVRRFEVSFGGMRYDLSAASPFTRRFVLKMDDRMVGQIAPAGFFTRKCNIDLPADIPVPGQLFMLWLVILMWRRAAQSSAANS